MIKETGALNDLCFRLFQRCTTKSSFKLDSLSATESSAKQHSLRIYLQFQNKLSYSKKSNE